MKLDFLRSVAALTLGSTLLLGTGCSSAGMYETSRVATVDNPASQIDENEIERAFEARPQLPARMNVAYFSYDPSKSEDLKKLVQGMPSAAAVYEIPPLLATGQHRLAESRPWSPAAEVSVKKLRLLAARAHADVLVIFDHGESWKYVPNGFSALSPLLVPMFITPWMDFESKSYVDAVVVDVRNGYLYGHIKAEEQDAEKRVTIYNTTLQSGYLKREWHTLREKTDKGLRVLLADEHNHAKPAAPPALAPAPAPAALSL